MSSLGALQQTETPPTRHSDSVAIDPQRTEIIQQMVLRKAKSVNGGTTTSAAVGGTETRLPASEEMTISLDLPRFRPNPVVSRPTFVAMQEWEGYVIEILDDVFTAHLIDKSSGDISDPEEAEFPISDVSDDDMDLLTTNAIFRWSIGYIRDRGTKIRASQLVFRRLPQWREHDLQDACEKAEQLANSIPWK